MSSVKFDALFPVDHVEDLTARNSEYFAQFSLSVTTILAMDSEKGSSQKTEKIVR